MEYLKSKFSNSMVVVRQELWDLILSASLLNEYSTCRLLSSPPQHTHTHEWLCDGSTVYIYIL